MLKDNDVKGSAEPGYLATIQDYSNYHFRVEFKWGTTRFAPRALAKRDSGIYFHITGPDRIWPTAPQLQIQETDLGDILALNGVRFTTAGRTPNVAGVSPPWPNPPKANAMTHGGPGELRNWAKSGDFEKLDDWNVLEIMANDDKAAFLVNGRLVNTLFNMQVPDPPAPANTPGAAPAAPSDKLLKLNRGKIALEIEYAEIWFRNVQIRPLTASD